MRRKLNCFGAIDPNSIMTVVVSLIVLSVGVFAFFTVMQQMPTVVNDTQDTEKSILQETVSNVSDGANSVFNIIGVVLIIGAIMSIVGLVYSYVGPLSFGSSSRDETEWHSDNIELPAREHEPDYVNLDADEEDLSYSRQRRLEEKQRKEEERQQKLKEQKEQEEYETFYKGASSRVGRASKMLNKKK